MKPPVFSAGIGAFLLHGRILTTLRGDLVGFFLVFEFCRAKNGAKEEKRANGLKNHKNLDWCKGKAMRSRKKESIARKTLKNEVSGLSARRESRVLNLYRMLIIVDERGYRYRIVSVSWLWL